MEPAFLRDICEHPGDDAPRLIFADWLEDNGRPERAEFIRGSIRVPQCSHLALTRDDPFPLLGLEPGTPTLVGGGPTGRGELRTWAWGETDALGLVVTDLGRGLSYRVDRGFVSGVMGTLADFLRHGKKLFTAHPIEEVRLCDREPCGQEGEPWWWYRGDSPRNRAWWGGRHHIPSVLFGLIATLDGDIWMHQSRDAAQAALSSACVAWGRQQAWLPPLEGQ